MPNAGSAYSNYYAHSAVSAVYGGSVLTNYMLVDNGYWTNCSWIGSGWFGSWECRWVSAIATNRVVYQALGGVTLVQSAYGQPAESSVAQYQLGDAIPWPNGVATNQPPIGFQAVRVGDNPAAYYQSTNPVGAAIYVPSLGQVIAAAGGNVEVDWQTSGGPVHTVYTIADTPRVRPNKIYWTEEPYNAPPIQLLANNQPVFATIHYNNYVTRPTLAVVSHQNEQGDWVASTQLVNGVWIDGSGSRKNIRAIGCEGMALMEYFTDGAYTRSMGIQPIQVLPALPTTIAASIGSRLLPQNLYYGTDDLIPNISAGGGQNGKVLLFSQDGPKNNWVFGIQQTVAAPSDVVVYWEHKDFRGVQWPFEMDWYALDWPPNALRYVLSDDPALGAPILISTELTASVPFQDQPHNAQVSVSGRSIGMSQPGYALLQYNSHNDIWFDVIRGVWHDDRTHFDQQPIPWTIGQEILPFSDENQVLGLDGANDYVDVSLPPSFSMRSAFTMEAWVYCSITNTAAGQNRGTIFGKPSDGGDFWLSIMQNGGMDLHLSQYAYVFQSPPNRVAFNSWQHVAVTWDGVNLAFYVNGSLTDTATYSNALNLTSANLRIGVAGTNTYNFAGMLDEMRIWTIARSQGDIQSNMFARLTGRESGLGLYFPVDESDGTLLHDLALGVCGTVYGAPEWIATLARGDRDVIEWEGFPGYVYPASGDRYNAARYTYPTETAPDALSHLFAVATNDLLEIWWARPSPNLDMTPAVFYPSLVQSYNNLWPSNAPQIVIAGGQGSLGAQGSGCVAVVFGDNAGPAVYYQNDPAWPGFNPNEEHALVLDNVAYALRNDLNRPGQANSSEPYVLIDYSTFDILGNPQPAMQIFQVVATNALYPAFTNALTAGAMIQPPMPLAVLPGVLNDFTACASGPGWRDRKLEWWACAAGDNSGSTNILMQFWYALQPGFYFPSLGANQLPAGTVVPWLSGDYYGMPVRNSYGVTWPSGVPEMQVGQTLYGSPGNSGLPDIHDQLSVDVLYQQSAGLGNRSPSSVTLIDPLLLRGAAIDNSIILQMAAAGKALRASPGTTYTFPGLPPSIADRLVYDLNQPVNQQLYVTGEYVETLSDGYLLLNLVEAFEMSNVLHQADGMPANVASAWQAAVSLLPTSAYVLSPNQPFAGVALSAGEGAGVGYVTVAFNNSSDPDMVPAALPVSLSILRVTDQLYDGSIEVLAPDSPLDEKLTLRQEADFGGMAENYFFEWRTLPPTDEGFVPTNIPPESWTLYRQGPDLPGVTIRGAGLFTLSDNYFQSRYRLADPSSGPTGTNWSDWVLGFAPGWIQRSLNGINPFEQRLQDLVNNAVDTSATLIQEAGAPYSGPVALNLQNINDFGLIQIYQTILERGEMLSLDAGFDYPPANAQLVQAAGRLNDLYMLLGNEAYADAMDPTLSFGSDDIQYGSQAGSLFCFMNQVPTLLDEELALLRGRDDTLQPPPTVAPFFNRLPWNFTRGINGGEVAYAMNYNIQANDYYAPTISADDAEQLYPQGHGDAWGHYLSAIGGYYRLLANTNFDWIPGIQALILGDNGNIVVNANYNDEEKFAQAAAARARAGADIVDRTYRKFYTKEPGAQFPGYRDENSARAWGVLEWASRAGQASLIDWAVAQSLLPDEAAPASRNWAMSFTNGGAYLDFGQHDLGITNLTLEMWVQTAATNAASLFGGYTTLWDGTPKQQTVGLGADGRVVWASPYDGQTIRSVTAVNDANWHHVAWVYSGAASTNPTRAIYVDGNQESIGSSVAMDWHNWMWTLGANQAGPGGTVGGYFNGNLDEVRLWTAARTTNQVQSAMNLCLGGHEPGLLAYYPFFEGSGAVAHDFSGAVNGTVYGAGWMAPMARLIGPPGNYALRFDGLNDRALAAGVPPIGGSNFTVEAWMAVSTPGLRNSIVGLGSPGACAQGLWLYASSSNVLRADLSCVTGPVSTATVADGQWHHVALVNSAQACTLYVDGQAAGATGPLAPAFGTNFTYVGAPLDGGSPWFFHGTMAEIRAWSCARAAADIQSGMRAALSGNEAGLALYYPVDSNSTQMLFDLTANGLDAAISGATLVQLGQGVVPPAPTVWEDGAAYPGIAKTDRTTVPALYDIASNHRLIQRRLDNVDQDLNPLGLAENAIPFDISPAEIDAGKTHFEQIYDRALVALNNANAAFDHAAGAGHVLRKQFDSTYDLATTIFESELDYHNRLIEIFGYPYDDDIGPTGAYPQGYDGPDLVNYDILDLESLIGTAPTGQPVQVVLYNIGFVPPSGSQSNAFSRTYQDYVLTRSAVGTAWTTTIYLAQNGLQVKPEGWTGHRQAQGQIQAALADYLQAYYDLRQGIAEYNTTMSGLEKDFLHLQSLVKRSDSEWTLVQKYHDNMLALKQAMLGLNVASEVAGLAADWIDTSFQTAEVGVPDDVDILGAMEGLGGGPIQLLGGIGLISRPVKEGVWIGGNIASYAIKALMHAKDAVNLGLEYQGDKWGLDQSLTLSTNEYGSAIKWAALDFEQSLNEQFSGQNALFQKIVAVQQAAENYRTLIAQGQMLINQRSLMRGQAAQTIQAARWSDMNFRVFRNDALQKYTETFDLAVLYAYLAAQAYDYETGLLSSGAGATSGRRFLADIVRARTLGRLVAGQPQTGAGLTSASLSDLLARMKADWDVLKSRFGFNNPETETGRFSLRTELFRAALTNTSDRTWQLTLNSYRVANLYDDPNFQKFCKPFSSTTNLEPGLIVPFGTTIMAGQNVFGNSLAGGDNAYDSSRAATKIRSIGIWFFNYNNGLMTNATPGGAMANEPHVYLIPVGQDILRSPSDVDVLRAYSIFDQAIPLPFAIGDTELDNPDWIPLYNSLSGTLAEPRRHPSLRAYHENDASIYLHDNGYIDPREMVSNARLVGRSVWNTQWLLVIPGRTLLEDPDEGLDRLIFGAPTGQTTGDPSADRDGNGIKDIRLLFKTYSVAGE